MEKLSMNAACFLICTILGNHSLYVSFDTLENLTLMEGNERMNFDALVPGWVQIVLF